MRLRNLKELFRPAEDRIHREAARWVVRLHEESFLDSHREDFHRWLVSDSRHRAAYLKNLHAWEQAGRLKIRRPFGRAPDPDLYGATANRMRLRSVAVSIAVAAILLTLGVMFVNPHGPERWVVYQTGSDELTRVTLTDGSTMELKVDSRVRVQMGRARRSVELARGQATFQVTHDSARPFDVTAADTTVRAVGTAFSLRLAPAGSLELDVSEGRVVVGPTHVLRAATPATLTTLPVVQAGEVATVGPDGVVVRRIDTRAPGHPLIARDDKRRFEGETLADAVLEFNRYNARPFRIEDPALARLRIGGLFRPTDETSFIAALEQSFGIQAVRKDGEILLTRPARHAH